jgi:transcriptional regulator with XRE-family HTH domain
MGEPLYKNILQQEFCALMQKMEEAGYNQATVARLLKRTPGAISQYRSGRSKPRHDVMDNLRRIADELTAPAKDENESDGRLHEQIEELRRFSPPDYEVIKTTITLLHRRLGPVNSDGDAIVRHIKGAKKLVGQNLTEFRKPEIQSEAKPVDKTEPKSASENH